MANNKCYLLLLLFCFVGVNAQLGDNVNDQTGVIKDWDVPASGLWVDEVNWDNDLQPRTIDDVEIDLTDQITVTLNESRLVRSTEVTEGNTLDVLDGVTLVLHTSAPPCLPGDFVDPADSQCKDCPGITIQKLRDQSWCFNCGLLRKINRPDRQECIFCRAGTVFENDVCVNCPQYQSSDGMGSDCFCCPDHTSSVSGGLCVDCSPGFDSCSCGPCVPCLPKKRLRTCPTDVAGNACSGLGSCTTQNATYAQATGLDILCPFMAQRQVCTCVQGTGFNCALNDPPYDLFSVDNYQDFSYELPFPFGVITRALPVGPTIEIPALTFSPVTDLNGGIRDLPLDTDWDAEGLVNPLTNGVPGQQATIFGWEFILYDPMTNQVIQELPNQPYNVVIPYDELDVINPNALEVYYWNKVELQWISGIFNCLDTPPPPKILDEQAGTITITVYQASAQFHIFLDPAADYNIYYEPDYGTGNGGSTQGSVGDQGGGNARPPTATTGLTGIAPVPQPPPPEQPGVSQPVRENAASNLAPSMLLLALVSFILLIIN